MTPEQQQQVVLMMNGAQEKEDQGHGARIPGIGKKDARRSVVTHFRQVAKAARGPHLARTFHHLTLCAPEGRVGKSPGKSPNLKMTQLAAAGTAASAPVETPEAMGGFSGPRLFYSPVDLATEPLSSNPKAVQLQGPQKGLAAEDLLLLRGLPSELWEKFMENDHEHEREEEHEEDAAKAKAKPKPPLELQTPGEELLKHCMMASGLPSEFWESFQQSIEKKHQNPQAQAATRSTSADQDQIQEGAAEARPLELGAAEELVKKHCMTLELSSEFWENFQQSIEKTNQATTTAQNRSSVPEEWSSSAEDSDLDRDLFMAALEETPSGSPSARTMMDHFQNIQKEDLEARKGNLMQPAGVQGQARALTTVQELDVLRGASGGLNTKALNAMRKRYEELSRKKGSRL